MQNYPKNTEIQEHYPELFSLSDEVYAAAREILEDLNKQKIKLFDVTAHKRIFLFILTRAMKSYSSIILLCRQGYGQDVSPLLRSLLENLVTARYITHDLETANDKTARFVAYKWVIFRRHLAEEEKQIRPDDPEALQIFETKKQMVLGKVDEFKKRFNIKSDKALISWSGKTVRDMAKAVSTELLDEYETTFRLCSRFAHPTILGDNEYIIQDEKKLTFSPLPSYIGIISHMKNAIMYMLEFLKVTSQLFSISDQLITPLEIKSYQLFSQKKYTENILENDSNSQTKKAHLRDSIIFFKI